MSRVIGDSRGSCRKRGLPSSIVVSGQLSVTAAAKTYGFSRQHLHRLLKRYREGGLEAVDARSRRPGSNPRAVSDEVIIAIVGLREQLTADGLDAGPLTLQWHLRQAGLSVPATSTIRRILHHHGLITPQPRKRPKNSYHRFEAAQPNECWQSDFTHWSLADGTDVEILNWLDDHSRYLLACTAYRACHRTRRGDQLHRDRSHLRPARIHPHRQRNGLHRTIHQRPQRLRTPTRHPGHHPEKRPPRPPPNPRQNRTIPPNPQTLAPPAPPPRHHGRHATTPRPIHRVYNTERTHRALPPSTTPAQAYNARPKANPTNEPTGHFRSPPRHHRPIRQTHPALRQPHPPPRHRQAPTPAPQYSSWPPQPPSPSSAKPTYRLIASHTIDPDRNYWRNQQKHPGRWPG